LGSGISLNPEFNCRVITVGEECSTVLIIDDLFTDVSALYDHVRVNVKFAPDADSYYPGVRAKLPIDYGSALMEFADACIREHHPIESGLKATPYSAFYSIVTSPEARLAPLQRIPHFDHQDQTAYAAMHYLAPGEFGGTGFFRHNPTGFERIGHDRREPYLASVAAFIAEHGEPPPAYINASTDQYELLASISYKPNRLLIYPGNLLHSGLINSDTDIYSGQGLARLTANVFLNYL
jgi:hypothetical protein